MEIHVREQCSGCQGKGFFPAPLLLNGEVSCGPCNGTGSIELWVQVSFTVEDLRMGRLMGEALRDRRAQAEKGN